MRQNENRKSCFLYLFDYTWSQFFLNKKTFSIVNIYNMLGIVLGILMFMFLVIIHELGHFWAAKKSGVKVKEFGI